MDQQRNLFRDQPETDASGLVAVEHFPGPEYQPERDEVRLTGQRQRIYNVMSDGEWRTIAELSRLSKAPENSASSQLRQLRWKANGGHTVKRRHVENGLYQYRLVVNT